MRSSAPSSLAVVRSACIPPRLLTSPPTPLPCAISPCLFSHAAVADDGGLMACVCLVRSSRLSERCCAVAQPRPSARRRCRWFNVRSGCRRADNRPAGLLLVLPSCDLAVSGNDDCTRYPFKLPLICTPSIKYRWNIRKIMTTGIITTRLAAINSFQAGNPPAAASNWRRPS